MDLYLAEQVETLLDSNMGMVLLETLLVSIFMDSSRARAYRTFCTMKDYGSTIPESFQFQDQTFLKYI